MERKHRHLLSCARALQFHASLSIIFRGDCLLVATYWINRTPTATLHDKSPYEVLYGKPPIYDDLKVFGTLCYATVVPQSSDKFASRAVKGAFLGYPYVVKEYRILNMESQQMFISRDARFLENVFPFKTMVVPDPCGLFPSSSVFIDEDPLHEVSSTDTAELTAVEEHAAEEQTTSNTVSTESMSFAI